MGAFVEMVTLAQHQTGSHYQDIQHRFPDTYHSVIICLADQPKTRFSIRAHDLEGEAFDTDMETGDIIVFNRYWHTGMRYSDIKNWKAYAIVRFVLRHESGALYYPGGLKLMRTLQGHIKVCPGGEARVGPRAGKLYDNYQLKGLINDEKDRLRELQLKHDELANENKILANENPIEVFEKCIFHLKTYLQTRTD